MMTEFNILLEQQPSGMPQSNYLDLMVWKSQGAETIKLARHERKYRETLTKCTVNAFLHHLRPAVLDLGGYVLANMMR